ncbi:MAG: TatD family hydrolase [Beutenbergiaceae bacterium]
MGRRGQWPADPEPLPAPVIDNHTHLESIGDVLDDDVIDPGVAAQLRRAAAVGVTAVVQIGCDLDSARTSLQWAHDHRQLVAGVAIHPNEAVLHAGIDEVAPDGLPPAPQPRHVHSLDEAIAVIADLARDGRVRTIGETGLDFFRAGERGRLAQRQSFRAHIALAKELGLPMQIHDRDAHAEVLQVLDADGAPEATVFHCFSGDEQFAAECVRRGYYLSFAGPVTFATADQVRAAAAIVPATQLLVETDAPFLTPAPHRGAPNAPYLLPHAVRRLAQVRGGDLAQLCQQLERNARRLYGPW